MTSVHHGTPFATGAHAPRPSVSASFRHMLENTKIGDIAPMFQSIVTATDRETVSSVFRKMINYGILSVPVTISHAPHNFVGFVDVFDIFAFIVQWGYSGISNQPQKRNKEEIMKWATNEALTSQPCWTSINKGFRNEPHAFRRETKLQEVINFMQSHSVRRVAIIGDDGGLLSVVTQSYVLRYLASHLKDIGNLGSMTVGQLQLGFRDVRSFPESSTALDAFMAMWQEGLSGAAVVDHHGKILGNLSIDDIKDIDHDAASFEKMFETCGNYIRHKLYGATVPRLISVDSSAHVRDVIQKFVDSSVHRLYVIDHDAHRHPVTRGVISLRDMLQLVVHFGLTHHGA